MLSIYLLVSLSLLSLLEWQNETHVCVQRGKYLVLVVVVIITEHKYLIASARYMNSLRDEVMHTNIQHSCLPYLFLTFPLECVRAKAEMT